MEKVFPPTFWKEGRIRKHRPSPPFSYPAGQRGRRGSRPKVFFFPPFFCWRKKAGRGVMGKTLLHGILFSVSHL